MKIFLSLFLVSICFIFQSHNPVQLQTEKEKPTKPIQVEGGLISGILNEATGIASFKGVPFAAPPVGDLRWRAPHPVEPWSGIKKCHDFGPSPMQRAPAAFSMWTEEFQINKEPISEDCLYLNVWANHGSGDEKKPVLVWIYGGGFNSGGGNVPIYDGEALASKGLVVVNMNYRVGIFGFYAHPELTAEAPHQSSGNYGLMDQIAALEWVQKNIAAFGGDPENVTIAGQSAGAMSVNCLVASPLAKGLFTKAIAESGANMVENPLRGSTTLQQAEQEGKVLANTLNANTVSDLRKIPASELHEKGQGAFRPIIDGVVLPESMQKIFDAKKQNDVVLLTGWNENEGFGTNLSAIEFQKQAKEQYGKNADTFLNFYPASSDVEAAISQSNLGRDRTFGVQNYAWANLQSKQGKKVYVYRFTRKVPATGEYVKYGAFHTGEVPYVFNNLKFVDRPWEPVDHEMADIMSSYWVNFATTGNPNGKGLPRWPEYDHKRKQILKMDTTIKATVIPDQESLDFLYKAMTGKL